MLGTNESEVLGEHVKFGDDSYGAEVFLNENKAALIFVVIGSFLS